MIVVIDDGMARRVCWTVRQVSLGSLYVECPAMFGLDGSIEDPVPDGAEDVAARVPHKVSLVETVLQTLEKSVTGPSYHVLGMKDTVVSHQPQVEVIVVTRESDLERLLTGSLAVRDGSLVPGVSSVYRLSGVVQHLVIRDVWPELGLAEDGVQVP